MLRALTLIAGLGLGRAYDRKAHQPARKPNKQMGAGPKPMRFLGSPRRASRREVVEGDLGARLLKKLCDDELLKSDKRPATLSIV